MKGLELRIHDKPADSQGEKKLVLIFDFSPLDESDEAT